MARIVFQTPLLISTGEEYFGRLIKSEPKHMVRLSSNRETGHHEVPHLLSGEQQRAVLVPLRGYAPRPSSIGRIHAKKEDEVRIFRHFKSAKPSVELKTLGRFSLWRRMRISARCFYLYRQRFM